MLSVFFALSEGKAAALTPALFQGAARGISLTISLAGPLCLWSGFNALIRNSALSRSLTFLAAPLLSRLFPRAWSDPACRVSISGNFIANFLGLGNAATPPGLEAVRRMSAISGQSDHELCRFILLNTASVQLLPTTVAVLRSSLGCRSPFDLLPCVWITSLGAVTVGLLAGRCFSAWDR